MYSLGDYGMMIADHARIDAYAQALRKRVRPGSVVLEIGTGPGIFAVLACQLGASHVYAIEPNDIIQVARDIAVANGCADRIEFIQDISTRVKLPTRADVIVSDLRGILPFYQHHIPSIVDARSRFLAPGGSLIPHIDKVWVTIIKASKPYTNIVDPWARNSLGQDLSPAQKLAVNNFSKIPVTCDQHLTAPQLWKTLDYATVENPDAQGELEWTIERAGTGHGIAVWFDTELADDVGFSCGDTPGGIYGSLFFPWEQPVPLAVGQTVRVALEARLVEDDYVWRWTTSVQSVDDAKKNTIRFDQSQLAGAPLSLATLQKIASDYVPELSEEGLLDRSILELIDGRATLEEIAGKLTLKFPQRFAGWRDALTAAGILSRKYSR
jgi:protein arginine N-methyltransferase 1